MEENFNLPQAVSECIESEYSVSSELIDGILTVVDVFTNGTTTAVVKLCKLFKTYTYRNFARNLLTFLKSLEGTTVEQRREVLAKMEKIGDDEAGIILTNIIDKLDHVKKSEIVANLFKASIDSKIDTEMFMRLSSVLICIPYVDLKHIKDFQNENYIPCVAEVLYSAGVICLCEIGGGDAASNGQDMYHITPIGYNLLRYGMNIDLEKVEGSSIKIQIQSEQFREEDFPYNKPLKLSEDEEKILRSWCESKQMTTKIFFQEGGEGIIDGGISVDAFSNIEWERKWKPFFDKCIGLEYIEQIKENIYTLTNNAFVYIEKKMDDDV